VTVTLPGTSIPHSTIYFIFNLIFVDIDSAILSNRWSNIQVVVTANTEPNPTSQTYNLDTSIPFPPIYSGYCGDTTKKDYQLQLSNTFPHYSINTSIIFTITVNNLLSSGQGTWVAREFIISVRTCGFGCLTCV
jgi:hypothetical protein